jgi:dihydrofolate reductase
MAFISVFNSVTLDGVMQAPGGKEEDTRDGFSYGGWAGPYNDQVKGQIAGEGMSQRGGLLFGRRTYEHMYTAWHGRTDPNPFTKVLDDTPKFVASNTLEEPLTWQNSTLLRGDAADAVAKLKQESPLEHFTVLGSGVLIRSLMKRNLIDQFILLIHPLVLGAGRRMFADDGTFAKFKMTRSVPTTTGVIIAFYELT